MQGKILFKKLRGNIEMSSLEDEGLSRSTILESLSKGFASFGYVVSQASIDKIVVKKEGSLHPQPKIYDNSGVDILKEIEFSIASKDRNSCLLNYSIDVDFLILASFLMGLFLFFALLFVFTCSYSLIFSSLGIITFYLLGRIHIKNRAKKLFQKILKKYDILIR